MTPDIAEGNFVSEWFGHRIYPNVTPTARGLADQVAQRCPFLSAAKASPQECVKRPASKGVCTISSRSNGPRQDWVVCPYRLVEPTLLRTIATRLYGLGPHFGLYAAPTLAAEGTRTVIGDRLESGERVFVYFDLKLGGEISLSATDSSPEMAFDVTVVELQRTNGTITLGKFALIEAQTMDFHGTYAHAVENLSQALRLHGSDFPAALRENPQWAAERIEGPNIANVFKRTFYQLMFKFSFGANPSCAGAALALPLSVWDSWQPFLSSPDLVSASDGTLRLAVPGEDIVIDPTSWIYVFDFNSSASVTPNPVEVMLTIGATTEALSHFALKEAPRVASVQLMSESGLYASLSRRLRSYWPDHQMARTG